MARSLIFACLEGLEEISGLSRFVAGPVETSEGKVGLLRFLGFELSGEALFTLTTSASIETLHTEFGTFSRLEVSYVETGVPGWISSSSAGSATLIAFSFRLTGSDRVAREEEITLSARFAILFIYESVDEPC